jgi:hypothetical protein
MCPEPGVGNPWIGSAFIRFAVRRRLVTDDDNEEQALPDVSVPDLTGKLAVVTGASDGIGLGLATRHTTADSFELQGGHFYGPDGFAHLTGNATEQRVYRSARDEAVAARLWDVCNRLAGIDFAAV